MIIEKDKSDAVESLFTGLTKASRWRRKLVDQYTDPRNARAAKRLAELADETSSLSDQYWEMLKPHFNSSPTRWREALSQATRQVGFVHKKTSFPFFVRILIGLLSESTVA
jgi:hypothetical protein